MLGLCVMLGLCLGECFLKGGATFGFLLVFIVLLCVCAPHTQTGGVLGEFVCVLLLSCVSVSSVPAAVSAALSVVCAGVV